MKGKDWKCKQIFLVEPEIPLDMHFLVSCFFV